MNIEPASEFDPAEQLACFSDPEHERYSLDTRIYFYLIQTCRAAESFAAPVFAIEAVLDPKNHAVVGCVVRFIIHRHAFLIDTGAKVRLWAASADEPDESRSRYLTYDGDASDPKSWENLLKSIGRVEGFAVFVPHADKLRHTWTEWLAAQQRRRDERGF
jgi:hypothetical protein